MKKSLLLFLLISSGGFAGNPILTYEPSKIELKGILDLQTFPGPPNYESIKEGDAIERHFYLKLDSPVDIVPKKEGHSTVVNPEPEKNIKVMMLAISADDKLLWKRVRKFGKGGHVRVNGTLFHRWTGHHHSRVILNVEKIEPLSSKAGWQEGG
ncbi:MAG: hypothetical protein RJB66_1 [Pseudomonadota bacterium]|jgi:hypothetical protein